MHTHLPAHLCCTPVGTRTPPMCPGHGRTWQRGPALGAPDAASGLKERPGTSWWGLSALQHIHGAASEGLCLHDPSPCHFHWCLSRQQIRVLGSKDVAVKAVPRLGGAGEVST